MKKVLSILIVICLIAGLLPVIASAATTAKVSIISDAGGACIQVTDATDGWVKITALYKTVETEEDETPSESTPEESTE